MVFYLKRGLSLAVLTGAVAPVVLAQQSPDAGSLLQQLQQERQLNAPALQFEEKTQEPVQAQGSAPKSADSGEDDQ